MRRKREGERKLRATEERERVTCVDYYGKGDGRRAGVGEGVGGRPVGMRRPWTKG